LILVEDARCVFSRVRPQLHSLGKRNASRSASCCYIRFRQPALADKAIAPKASSRCGRPEHQRRSHSNVTRKPRRPAEIQLALIVDHPELIASAIARGTVARQNR
jgi:hypothetical protein